MWTNSSYIVDLVDHPLISTRGRVQISGPVGHVLISGLVDYPGISRLGHMEISRIACHVLRSGILDHPRPSRLGYIQIRGSDIDLWTSRSD